MTINNKTGEVKLNGFDVKVDNFSKPRMLEKAIDKYNNNKDLEIPFYPPEGWPEGEWNKMYWDMWKNLLKWKKKRTYT